jgi:hypothetical protein
MQVPPGSSQMSPGLAQGSPSFGSGPSMSLHATGCGALPPSPPPLELHAAGAVAQHASNAALIHRIDVIRTMIALLSEPDDPAAHPCIVRTTAIAVPEIERPSPRDVIRGAR